MKWIGRAVAGAVVAGGLFLAACGSGGVPDTGPATSTAVGSATAASSTTTPSTAGEESSEEAVEAEPDAVDTESPVPDPATPDPATPRAEAGQAPPVETVVPHPVDCQTGMGPVVTTWSDGTVGDWSQQCQDLLDRVVQDEAEANTPVCDGTVCVYPNGATVPDTSAPSIPSDTSGAVCDDVQCTYPNGYVARIGDPEAPNYLKPGNSPWGQDQIEWMNCLDGGRTPEQCRAALG